MLSRAETCFFERDPSVALCRRATVEGIGTLLLMLAATGSGLMAQRLVPAGGILVLMTSAVATAGALVSLIVAFGAVSGGHFNPLITLLQWLGRERTLPCTLGYVAAQFAGAATGAVFANKVFASAVRPLVFAPPTWALIASETLATAGLMIVVFGCARSGKAGTGPFAVGAWLVAAIVATPSNSYANPAISFAAIFADGPIALPAAKAWPYLAAETVGALMAFAVIAIAYPRCTHATAPASIASTSPGALP
jgi:glycerol uptake facilitator-like aquaporin